MPRSRLTLRRMMIAVAVVALGVGGWTLYGRRLRYLDLAADYAAMEQAMRARAEKVEEILSDTRLWHAEWRRRGGTQEELIQFVHLQETDWTGDFAELLSGYKWMARLTRSREADFERLRAKYERAARYPWLPVAPDPPALK